MKMQKIVINLKKNGQIYGRTILEYDKTKDRLKSSAYNKIP